jgi:hypothetical protein
MRHAVPSAPNIRLYNTKKESRNPNPWLKVVAQTALLDEPSHKTMIIRLLSGPSLLVLFAQLDQPVGLLHSKALIQEGIDEQINVLLHM